MVNICEMHLWGYFYANWSVPCFKMIIKRFWAKRDQIVNKITREENSSGAWDFLGGNKTTLFLRTLSLIPGSHPPWGLKLWHCVSLWAWLDLLRGLHFYGMQRQGKFVTRLTIATHMTIRYFLLRTSCRQKAQFALKENCRMKTSPGSKTQSELNNGIFFHSKLLSQHHFLCFQSQKREGWPISQLSHNNHKNVETCSCIYYQKTDIK